MDRVRAKFKRTGTRLGHFDRVKEGYGYDREKDSMVDPDGNAVERADAMEVGSQPTVLLTAVTADDVPDNQRYHSATPSGSMELTITNADAAEFLEPGATFYVDFTRAD